MNYIISEEELKEYLGYMCLENIAELLKSKKPVQVFDRDNVEELLSMLIHKKITPEDFLTAILQLIPQQITEKEIRDICHTAIIDKTFLSYGDIIEWLVKELSNLYKGEEDGTTNKR